MVALISLILLVCLSAFYLRIVMGLLGEEIPGISKVLFITPTIAATGYLVFSGLSYLVLLALLDAREDDHVPGFTQWLFTTLSMKYKVLGQVPLIRYPAIMVTFAIMGILQVLFLTIPFRRAMLVFVFQWGMAFISLFLAAKLLSLFPQFNQLMLQ